MRQKITLSSSRPNSLQWNGRNRDSDIKDDVKPSSLPNISHSLLHGRETADSNALDAVHTTCSPNHNRFSSSECIITSVEGYGPPNSSGVCVRKSVHSPSKVNENATGAGVLRYALHLRFLCPFPKKYSRSVQRCKSNPLSAPVENKMDIEGDRRFYLYSNMRVVFPQRHSDADEGKVCFMCVRFMS